ncbi:winged helix DNA-binding domain-containing protein [Actinophytocola sp.]|uniref:winged helix DNA-binding domain-containing protein n=1 Tax=Actinophytocola sp. TaxID=1872138 RepID=UPI002ED1C64F
MAHLSRRTLNRTLLTRQFLTERTSLPASVVVERLVAMQSQEPNWPYVGLWTRVAGFRHDDLTALLHDRSVVRSTVLRRTQHLVSGNDFGWLRPTIQPIVDSALRSKFFLTEIDGMDLDELAMTGRELLAGRTLTRREFGRLLAERFPGRHAGRLASTVELKVALVHAPADGAWGRWGTPSSVSVTLAEEWTGRPMATARQLDTMIHRYLAAFGPASVPDMQAWSGLTRLREVVDGMALRAYRDEHGKELFDLPDTPLAEDDTPTPVRFLPGYDNLLLGHADRTRVVSDEDRKQVTPGGAVVRPTFLVDGFVRGLWSVADSTLTVIPFRPLSKMDTAAVRTEAERLLPFVTNAKDAHVAFE